MGRLDEIESRIDEIREYGDLGSVEDYELFDMLVDLMGYIDFMHRHFLVEQAEYAKDLDYFGDNDNDDE